MFGKSKGNESGITLIANNCKLSGDVHFSDHLLVNGTVKGNIYALEGSRAIVTISEKGKVEGDIRVPNVIVNGRVYGDIHCDKHIELATRAEIKGNVFYNLIEMVMGSRVDGNLVHVKNGKEVKLEPETVDTGQVVEKTTEYTGASTQTSVDTLNVSIPENPVSQADGGSRASRI